MVDVGFAGPLGPAWACCRLYRAATLLGSSYVLNSSQVFHWNRCISAAIFFSTWSSQVRESFECIQSFARVRHSDKWDRSVLMKASCFFFFFLNPLECIEAVCLMSHYTIACLIYLGPFGQSLPGAQTHTSVPAGQYCLPHLTMGGGLLSDFCLEFYIDAYPGHHVSQGTSLRRLGLNTALLSPSIQDGQCNTTHL